MFLHNLKSLHIHIIKETFALAKQKSSFYKAEVFTVHFSRNSVFNISTSKGTSELHDLIKNALTMQYETYNIFTGKRYSVFFIILYAYF